MPRFFADRSSIDNDRITLSGNDAHHIFAVLRMRPGGKLTVSDFFNREYSCTILEAANDRVLLQIDEERLCQSEPPFPVTLLMALPKGDKFETVIQKSVELGVSRIIPFFSRCTVVRFDQSTAQKKAERFRRIAKSAAEQCGRGIVPEIDLPLDFKDLLSLCAPSDALKLFCYEKEDARSLRIALESAPTPREIVFMVGAEGGFTPEEAIAAANAGFLPVSLGRRILRCETAPLCVLSQLAFFYDY